MFLKWAHQEDRRRGVAGNVRRRAPHRAPRLELLGDKDIARHRKTTCGVNGHLFGWVRAAAYWCLAHCLRHRVNTAPAYACATSFCCLVPLAHMVERINAARASWCSRFAQVAIMVVGIRAARHVRQRAPARALGRQNRRRSEHGHMVGHGRQAVVASAVTSKGRRISANRTDMAKISTFCWRCAASLRRRVRAFAGDDMQARRRAAQRGGIGSMGSRNRWRKRLRGRGMKRTP